MPRKYDAKKKMYRSIALRRIHYLFSLAEISALQGKLQLANRYVELARKISMKYLVPIPKQYARCFCKHCYHYLLPPLTCRVRIHRGIVIIYCMKCKKFSRIPLHARTAPDWN